MGPLINHHIDNFINWINFQAFSKLKCDVQRFRLFVSLKMMLLEMMSIGRWLFALKMIRYIHFLNKNFLERGRTSKSCKNCQISQNILKCCMRHRSFQGEEIFLQLIEWPLHALQSYSAPLPPNPSTQLVVSKTQKRTHGKRNFLLLSPDTT